MEELDLKDLLNLFMSKIFQMLIIVLVFAGFGIVYTIGFKTPMYTSETTLVLTAEQTEGMGSTNTITATDVTLNSKLISTYSVLVKSDKVIRKVISNLGIEVSADRLKKNVSVKLKDDTEVIEISVSNENAAYAAKIANEIAKVFSTEVSEIYSINNIHIVDEAEVKSSPSNVNHIKDIIIFIFIGVVVAVAYVLVANMLDTTIKTAEDIEKGFGIPVIASIPFVESFDTSKGGKRK